MQLAINGGPKIRYNALPSQNTVGTREIAAAFRVLSKGLLTGYQANLSRHHGGEEVKALCEEWNNVFGPSYDREEAFLFCTPTNSCTSSLLVALLAAGVGYGDEVIVTPYSMTCSASLPLLLGAVPVFADIEAETFNLDPVSVEARITPRTKAILVVDLFGHPYDSRIDEIAKRHGLVVIEDAAQAVGALRDGRYAGTLGDIGAHSFNLGKHLTCGEGGMIVTKDGRLSSKCKGIVNHADSVNHDMERIFGAPLVAEQAAEVGLNLRMTEVNAAIVRVQLARRDVLIEGRAANARKFGELIADVPGLRPPVVKPGCTHTHYVYPLLFDTDVWGVGRKSVVNAIRAELEPCACRPWEGVPIGSGYIEPLWRFPAFRERGYRCETPVCDRLYQEEMIVCHRFFGPNADPQSLRDVANAFIKVWENRDELR